MRSLLFEQKMRSIREEVGYLSPSRILYEILREPYIKDYTYIISGRPGPTGKTWLSYKLESNEYKVVEISEKMYNLVHYEDADNHCLVDDFRKAVIIVLNRTLPQYENKD